MREAEAKRRPRRRRSQARQAASTGRLDESHWKTLPVLVVVRAGEAEDARRVNSVVTSELGSHPPVDSLHPRQVAGRRAEDPVGMCAHSTGYDDVWSWICSA